MELYARVRRAVFVEGVSEREAAQRFGLARETVRKMLRYAAPPGYRRQKPIRRPRLDPYTGVIDQILESDEALPKKQQHTAQRIFERLRDEHDFAGGYTIIKDYVRLKRTSQREMFVPLTHPPGHVKAFPLLGWRAAADSLPTTQRLAVARILGDGTRQKTQVFSELQSHYLFEERFGRPGKGNDKEKVENLVKVARRSFFVPRPRFPKLGSVERRAGRAVPQEARASATRASRDDRTDTWEYYFPLLPSGMVSTSSTITQPDGGVGHQHLLQQWPLHSGVE